MVANGSKWFKIDRNCSKYVGSKYLRMIANGSQQLRMVSMVQNGPNGSKWTERFQIVPTVTNGSKLPNALEWFPMDPNGS